VRVIVTCEYCGEEVDASLTPGEPERTGRDMADCDPAEDAALDPPDCPACGEEFNADEVERDAKDGRMSEAENKAEQERDER